MKVFVGGAFQGKKKAAMEKTGLCETDFLDGETCTKAEREEALDAFVQELFRKNPDIVIVSTELGYGIVPIDAFDRLYREKVGRILCKAVEQAEEVYRVVAGIPVCIKGEKV